MRKDDLKVAGVCGLFCLSCTCYIGTESDPKRLEVLALRSGLEVQDFHCRGCRSDTLSKYCKSCSIRKCAEEKRIDFCSECGEYPCERLETFQAQLPHRKEIRESLEMIQQKGMDEWMQRMTEEYSCPKCGEMNSAYDLKCRICGSYPGNEFVKKHGQEIISHLKK